MFKQVIVLRTDLKMGKGKMVAQGSHASLEAYNRTLKKNPGWASAWLSEGQKKIVLRVESREALVSIFESAKNRFPSVLISDAGHTQVEPGTTTALGIGPAPESELDKIVSSHRLL